MDVSMTSTDQTDKLDCSIVDLLPVESIEHIFTFLSLDDRKKIRLTCKLFNEICNSRRFLKKEKFVLRQEYADDSPCTVLSKTSRPILHLEFVNVNETFMTESFWKKIGDRVHSLEIDGRYYKINNTMLRNVLFYCTNSDSFLFKRNFRNHENCYTHRYRLVSVSDASLSYRNITIRPLNRCCCSPGYTKEMYASVNMKCGTDRRILVETIYPDAEPQKRCYRFLLNGINYLEKGIFHRNDHMRCIGVQIESIKTLKRLVCANSNLRALVVRFDSIEENSDSSTGQPLKTIQSSSLEQHLEHLTIYGGFRGTLRIFENFALPSVKHLDIYASDIPLMTERDKRSSIVLVLNYVARRLPNLQILRVNNVNEWVEVRTTLGDSTSNFQIKGEDEDVCSGDECCKLSSVRHRFKSRNYRLIDCSMFWDRGSFHQFY